MYLLVVRQKALCSGHAGESSLGFLSRTSVFVVIAAADAVLFDAGFAPRMASYCGSEEQ